MNLIKLNQKGKEKNYKFNFDKKRHKKMLSVKIEVGRQKIDLKVTKRYGFYFCGLRLNCFWVRLFISSTSRNFNQ